MMTLRRTWLSVVALLAAVSASAQTTPVTPEITPEQKAEVLAKIDQTLKDTAFVPGVKFDQWPKFLEERKQRIDDSTTKRAFAMAINRALRDFGLSHMSVGLKRTTTPGGSLALQEPQTQPTFAMQELTWLDDKTVVFRLRTFGEKYDRKEVEKLMGEAQKAETLILDLRSNGGGAVSNLQHFLSHFLPPKTVVGTMVSRRVANAYQRETSKDPSDGLEIAKWTDSRFRTTTLKSTPYAGKVAVLINRASASASEICAAALREHKKSPLVGSRSAGAVLVSRVLPLPYGFEMKVPTADFYTSTFERLEGNPLKPDAEVSVMDAVGLYTKAREMLASAGG
jgi:hypothetical protein